MDKVFFTKEELETYVSNLKYPSRKELILLIKTLTNNWNYKNLPIPGGPANITLQYREAAGRVGVYLSESDHRALLKVSKLKKEDIDGLSD